MTKFALTTICALCDKEFKARTTYGICPNCFDRDKLREWDRLQSAITFANRQHVPVSLTLREWLSIVSDFKGKCAYCEEVPYSLLIMVNPSHGLVQQNALPCCKACNVHRQDSFENARTRVQVYLEQKHLRADDDIVYEPIEDEPIAPWVHFSEA
jgi:hypothetical protein